MVDDVERLVGEEKMKGTYNCVKIGRCPVECYVDIIPANIKILVMKWLVDVSDELKGDIRDIDPDLNVASETMRGEAK